MVARVFQEIERDADGSAGGGNVRPVPEGHQLPLRARAIPAEYHFRWGHALLEGGRSRKGWEESLTLSLSYSPFYLPAWYHRAAGLLPRPWRATALGAYGVAEKLGKRLLARSRRTPLLNGTLRRLLRAVE